jgi:hypothetical protein
MSLTKVTYSMIDGPQANVKDFGAVGNGVADDSAAIQAALDSGYPTIVFPSGTYLCSSPLSKTLVGGELNLVGEGLVKIFSTLADPSVLLTINGTITAGSALLANVSEGATTITTNESLAVGDLIRIRSSVAWNPSRSDNYKKAEFARVAGVSGTTISLEWPLYDSYTAATTTVFKLNAPRVSMTNLSFLTAKATTLDTSLDGVVVRYCQQSRFDRVSVKNFTTQNLEIRDSFDIVVNQCETYGDFFVGQGEGYGLLNTDCQNFNVYGGVYVAGRHGIATGGGSVVRNFNVDGATVSAAGSFAFDTHEGQDNVVVKNCDIRTGLSVFVKSAVVQNNMVRGNLQVQTMKSGGYTIISNNKVTEGEIQVSTFTDSGAVQTDLVSIDNNYVSTSVGGAFRFNSSIQGADDWDVTEFKMTNNAFRTFTSGAKCCNFQGNAATVTIGDMRLLNNYFFSNDSLSFDLNENQFVVNYCAANGNTFETANAASGNARFMFGTASATEANFYGNKFFEGTYGLYFNSYSGMLFLNDNIFKNCDYSFETKASPNWNNLWSTNNIEINVPNGWNSIIETSQVQSPSQNGLRQIVWADAAPTTGTWERGSIAYKPSPSAAGKIGFVCTAGGTPGTWKEFGAIDA